MTKREKERLLKLIEKAKNEKAIIAAARDRLRETYEEMEEIVDSADEAMRELSSALDTLSQYL